MLVKVACLCACAVLFVVHVMIECKSEGQLVRDQADYDSWSDGIKFSDYRYRVVGVRKL